MNIKEFKFYSCTVSWLKREFVSMQSVENTDFILFKATLVLVKGASDEK